MSAETEAIKEKASETSAFIGGLVNVGAGLYTNWRNRKFQEEQNEIDRAHEKEVRAQDRAWALEDWEKNAAYNSPLQQMQRFKEAGLNPNLIYGKANEMPMVRSTSVAPGKGSAPRIDNPLQNINVAQAYYSIKMMDQQIELGKKELQNKQLENENKMIENRQQAIDYMADVSGADKGGNRALARIQEYQKSGQELAQLQLETQVLAASQKVRTEQEFEKLIKLQKDNARSDMERDYLQKKMELLNDQHQMNEFEIQLSKMGVTKSDPIYYRWLNMLVDAFMGGLK